MQEKSPLQPNTEHEQEHEQGTLSKVALFFLELIKIAVLAVISIVVIRHFLFKPFYVKGQSMEPTFQERDYLIVDELSYRFREPKRGEVIVFRAPSGADDYLKRIVGLPGERVKVEGNKIIIFNDDYPQGKVMHEAYLTEDTPGSSTVTLGDEQYYVLGDNRDASYDSRRFGAVDADMVVGRVWFRGWPFSRVSGFDLPDYNL